MDTNLNHPENAELDYLDEFIGDTSPSRRATIAIIAAGVAFAIVVMYLCHLVVY